MNAVEAPALRLSNDTLAIEVSALGAELRSLRTADGSEWLWQGNPTYWELRAPILFPVVGRSPGDRISINGRTYPMQSHGFARSSLFSVLDCERSRCHLRLTESAKTHRSFPFSFQLDIAFVLAGSTLAIAWDVTNNGSEVLPCSIGFHPGFVWPLPGAKDEDHFVTLDSQIEPRTRRLDGRGLLTPDVEASPFVDGRLLLRHALFDRGPIILDEAWGKRVTFGAAGGPDITVVVEGMPHLGLWSLRGGAFLCVEPWHGMAAAAGQDDALEMRPGIMHVAVGATRSGRMTLHPDGNE